MTKAEQITIDDRQYALWKRSLPGPARWRIRSALPRSARTFAPEIVAAAEESVYAKEREAVLRYKGLVPELTKDAAYGLETGRVRSDYEHTTGNTQRQDLLLHAASQPELAIELQDEHARSVSCWQEPNQDELYQITICGIVFKNCTADQLKRVRAATSNTEAMRVVMPETYSESYPELKGLALLRE